MYHSGSLRLATVGVSAQKLFIILGERYAEPAVRSPSAYAMDAELDRMGSQVINAVLIYTMQKPAA